MGKRILFAPLLLLLCTGLRVPAQETKTTFWLRIWPDFLVEFDPATDRVVRKIQNHNGVSHGTQLSHDKRQFFLITGQRTRVEVVDIERGERVDEHIFDEPGYIIRVDRVLEIPGGQQWYVKIDKVKRELDHFKLEEPQWLLYDLEERKVEKRLKKLPKAIRSGARISPDGTKWHVFGKDLVIVNPETFEEEGKIELSKPLYSGMGPLRVRGDDFFDGERPTAYRMYYTMQDPLRKNRTLAGVLDLDLEQLEVTNRNEWGVAPRVRSLHMTKDKKYGIGQKRGSDRRSQSDGDDPILTLVTYDMEEGQKLRETRIDPVRNGLRLTAVAPDGQKIYLTGRGHELVVYDAEHKYLKTIELEGETDGQIIEVTR